jgi:predicted metal-dependent peptidase
MINMTDEKMSAEDKIIAARVHLISKMPFYGSLTMHLHFKENNKMPMPTIAVSPSGHVFYDTKFIDSLSLEETEGVICHEVMHVVLQHLERLGTRNPTKFNVAIDHADNLIINKDFKLPKGALMDNKYQNMSAEQIYDALPQPKECKEDCKNCPINSGKAQASGYGETQCKGGHGFDKHITQDEIDKAQGKDKDGNGGKGKLSQEEIDAMGIPEEALNEDTKNKPNWRKILADAANYAKSIGKLPAGMERLVEDLVEPQLSWRELLAQFITRSMPFDYSYRRRSRRSISTDIYFPGVEKEEVKVTIVVDTSGSIGEEELRDFMSEVLGLLKQFERVEIELFSCDAYLSKVTKVSTEYDLAATRLQGGGGTDYGPIFRRIRDKNMDTKILVYFGDMYAQFPTQDEVPNGLTTIFVVSKGGDENAIPPFFPYKVKLK